MEHKTRKEQIIEVLKIGALERKEIILKTGIISNNFNREMTPLIKCGKVVFQEQSQRYELKTDIIPPKNFTRINQNHFTPESKQHMKRDIILDWLKDCDLSRQDIQRRISASTGKQYSVSNLKRNLYPYLNTGLIRTYPKGREVIYTLGINSSMTNQRLPNETDLIIERSPSLKAFLDMRETELRKSAKSTRMYAYKIANLYKFLGLSSHGIRSVESIKESDIKEYIRHLVTDPKRRVSANTQANILALLGSYFRYCIENGPYGSAGPKYITINPIENISRPKVTNTQQTDLEPEYYNKMKQITKKEKDLLWETVLEYMLFTGSRVSEIANLLLERPNDEDKRDRERDEFSYPLWNTEQIHYFGKGNKMRTNKIDSSVFISLKRYINTRKPMDPNEPHLFLNKVGQPLSENNIKKTIKELRRKAGITEKITAHSFRRTCARWLYENGMDVADIQIFLGHEHIETTMRYLRIKETHKDQAYEKAIVGFKTYLEED